MIEADLLLLLKEVDEFMQQNFELIVDLASTNLDFLEAFALVGCQLKKHVLL